MVLHKIKDIILQINKCKDYIKTLSTSVREREDVLRWFEELCKHLTKIIFAICELFREEKDQLEKGNRDTLLLYLTQLLTSLSLLINVFVKESEVQQVINEARLCAKKQITWCLDGIEGTLTNNSSILDPSGNFIKWMDSALDKISEINMGKEKDVIISIYNDSKVRFEEVLCHAMSIAQVVLQDDCKRIRGSSQTVLDSLDYLTKEIQKDLPNPSMVNLFVDMCTDKLCALERSVNMAVLKLCLKVFSEFTVALKEIKKFCFATDNTGQTEELDMLVADFDLHVDRIMQIGLFAVSCSTSTNSCVKIRSCLASLELLECELVPAFRSVTIEKSVRNVNLALLLENHWLQQALTLKKHIFLIVDPFAFCEVIFEENKQIVDDISNIVKCKSSILEIKHMRPLIDNSEVLLNFVSTILTEEHDSKNTGDRLVDFKNVLHEVKCASNLFLGHKNDDNTFRLWKRCKILLTTTKKLWYCFKEEADGENGSSTGLNKSAVTADKPSTGNPFLDHIINRGKQILQERSILYKSSTRNETFNLQTVTLKKISRLKEPNKAVPLSKLVHLRKLSFMSSATRSESSELHMSDILNELNNLTNTFTK